jgi:hypothetical protein
MANEQYAFIDKDDVPMRVDWQAAIDESGFDFQLDPELKPFESSGFSPCKLLGKEAGFEIYYEDSPEFLADFADIANGKNCCITFRWGGSMIECASVMISSYALAKRFGAIVSYEGEDPSDDMEALLAETKGAVEFARKEF